MQHISRLKLAISKNVSNKRLGEGGETDRKYGKALKNGFKFRNDFKPGSFFVRCWKLCKNLTKNNSSRLNSSVNFKADEVNEHFGKVSTIGPYANFSYNPTYIACTLNSMKKTSPGNDALFCWML